MKNKDILQIYPPLIILASFDMISEKKKNDRPPGNNFEIS